MVSGYRFIDEVKGNEVGPKPIDLKDNKHEDKKKLAKTSFACRN